MKDFSHTSHHMPVMTNEAIDALVVDSAGIYVDATYGRGGHSSEILSRLAADGKLFAFDCDREAITAAELNHRADARFEPIHTHFSGISAQLHRRCAALTVNGIVADLGVSTPQLEQPARGFSFQQDGPLDMRMNSDSGMSAAQWLQQVSEKSLAEVLRSYGDERYARRIAKRIVSERDHNPIRTTGQLANLICDSIPTREKGKHPATPDISCDPDEDQSGNGGIEKIPPSMHRTSQGWRTPCCDYLSFGGGPNCKTLYARRLHWLARTTKRTVSQSGL